MQNIIDMLQAHVGAVVAVAALATELLLRKIPGARPITKILYEVLGKVVKDETKK